MKSIITMLIFFSLATSAVAHPCNEAWRLQRNEIAKALEKDVNADSREVLERSLSGGFFFDQKKPIRVFYLPKRVEANSYFFSLIETISSELGFPPPILATVPEEADIFFVLHDNNGLTHPESISAISAFQPDEEKKAKLLENLKDAKGFGIKFDHSVKVDLPESSHQNVPKRLVTIKAVDDGISTLALNVAAAWHSSVHLA